MSQLRQKKRKTPIFLTIVMVLFTMMIALFASFDPVPIEEKPTSASRADSKKGNDWVPATTAKQCHETPIKNLKKYMMSQSKEDEILLNIFHGLCGGTYLEMGGFNGVKYSNTYVFNKSPSLKWKGVLVELGPKNFAALKKNRPNELATVHAGVCAKAQTLHYVEAKATGGIWEFSDEEFRNKFWSDIDLKKVPTIKCSPLRDILQEHVGEPFYFDFFSLDVEGAEEEVVKSLDFTKVAFGVIFVEADQFNPEKNQAVRTLLVSSGYKFLFHKNRSDWFYNEHFHDIYNDLLDIDLQHLKIDSME
mmetsp:Transcript_26332/g.39886  ORF Transcript_26332/g.39886 Transcript_26332/m.39886 type:complete len:305 (+) Transcript_26332:134-1048(+)|eukprot:CAMPEP_0178896882 /NCGR_PEP_ID=MMETSP0786-20121207/1431_1 /TAXON_ID=186022 /ORGANISM="Thalassionema frauenfeldii, Strain CCMP 1798" /LENGTH=304 /DNA_ID=CAMNT_0020567357 /DNA_START=22 /DNA_END=936 /DNA_ORIENTATION=+